MDDASQAVIEQGGMPSGDEAEKALEVVTRHALLVENIPYLEIDNIRRCLIAFLAVMRMHEAKQEHGVGDKPEH